MNTGKTIKKEKLLEIGFGRTGGIKGISPFAVFRNRGSIKPLSGEWAIKDDQLQTYCDKDTNEGSESVLLIGSGKWRNYNFAGYFTFISGSVHPDEGGIILYFRYKNKKNHYSFHFCFAKKRIELWKRFRSRWSKVGEGVPYSFQLQQQYLFAIETKDNRHICYLDRKPVFHYLDTDIPSGCAGLAAKYCSAGFKDIAVYGSGT